MTPLWELQVNNRQGAIMKEESIIQNLKQLVLNEREAKVYVALIKKSVASAAELHEISGVAKNKIYDILNNLNIKGFCSKQINGKNTLYKAISPKISFEKLLNKKQQEIILLEDLETQLLHLYKDSFDSSNLADFIETIHGAQNVHHKYLQLLEESTTSILTISASPYSIKSLEESNQQLTAAKNFMRRGGLSKTLLELDEDSPAFLFSWVEKSFEFSDNEVMKIIKKSPIKLSIFDNKLLMTFNKTFSISDEDLAASVIKQAITVETYTQMFNYLWEQAESLSEWIDKNKQLYENKLAELK